MSFSAEAQPLDLEAASSGAPSRNRSGGTLVAERVAENAWDGAVADFDEVCQEQLVAFAALRWPGVELEPLLFRSGDEVVGGALVMIQPLPLGLGALAVVKWAPMLKTVDRPDALAIYEGMIDELVARYADERKMMLSVLPHAEFGEANARFAHLVGRGFRSGSQLLFPNRYIVNLRLTDEELRKSFAQKWRYHLNKSQKADLTFERAAAEDFGDFDALYQAMTDRKRFPDHSAYDTLGTLMELPVEGLRPELFFVRHEEETVAGAVIFKAGDRAVYLYGATNEAALPLRAGYFLHWHIIRWLRDNTRARWYDLGGTDGFQGLHQFKKGMVGDKGHITPVPPVANYASRWRAFVFGHAAFAARDAQQQLARWIDRVRGDMANPDQERGR